MKKPIATRVWVNDYGEAPIPADLWLKYSKAFRKDGWFDGRRKRLATEAKAALDALVEGADVA